MDARTLVRTKGPVFALEIGVNFVLPFLVYSWAAPNVGDVKALLASSIPPIAWSVVEFARHRRLDALSILVLAGIVLSLLAFMGGGGAKMLQLREKLVTGVIGVVFLLSAAIRRPLIYEIARAANLRSGSTAEADRMASLKDDKFFRRSMTLMTLVWGFGLVLDVAVASVMVFALTIKQYLIAGPIEGYIFTGALALWTFWYARRAKLRGEAFRARMREGATPVVAEVAQSPSCRTAALDASIALGLADTEVGRTKTAGEVFDRLEAKYHAMAEKKGK